MIINILKANNRIKELEANEVEWATKFSAKDAELLELQKAFEAETDKIVKHNDILNAMKAEHEIIMAKQKTDYEAKIAELDKKLLESLNSTGKQALDIVASIGIPAEQVKEVAKTNTPQDILNQFHALSGLEQTNFFKAHKDEIFKALGR
jgi:Tfp pilus assembly protein FimV